MEKHPIQGIMSTTMDSLRDMVDVNTVIGDAISTPDGTTIIPISRVCFGFVAGGGEYETGAPKREADASAPPFAGGAGAGVTVQPVGFLSIGKDQIRMLPAQYHAPLERVIELAPQALSDIKQFLTAALAKKQPPEQTPPPSPPEPAPAP